VKAETYNGEHLLVVTNPTTISPTDVKLMYGGANGDAQFSRNWNSGFVHVTKLRFRKLVALGSIQFRARKMFADWRERSRLEPERVLRASLVAAVRLLRLDDSVSIPLLQHIALCSNSRKTPYLSGAHFKMYTTYNYIYFL
jgi:hypothetical protein